MNNLSCTMHPAYPAAETVLSTHLANIPCPGRVLLSDDASSYINNLDLSGVALSPVRRQRLMRLLNQAAMAPSQSDQGVVILTGPSGVGKTTTLEPALEQIGGKLIGSGSFCKALLCQEGVGHFYPSTLDQFISSGLFEKGLHSYEQLKSEKKITGYQIILGIETLRAVMHDLTFRTVYNLGKLSNQGFIITDAINDEELGYFKRIYPNNLVVGLDVTDRVQRTGENRNPITRDDIDLSLSYKLNDLDKVAEVLKGKVREWLNKG